MSRKYQSICMHGVCADDRVDFVGMRHRAFNNNIISSDI